MRGEFKLYVKPNVVLYDGSLQEVKYSEVLDDGVVMYRLKPVWSEKLKVFVSRPLYAVQHQEKPFARYVEKVMCVGDKSFDVKGSYKCRGGRVVAKLVMWVLDKRFRELCELL
jgi:hypothetical protein